MAKKVTKIVAAPSTLAQETPAPMGKRRACGYARVSTDKDSQESSFENQMQHYTEYINGRPDLEFVGMYSDEGITGTSTKRREGFNQMVRDALDGKIDLIITKSVSRFARNTVDSLTTIRKLKEKGVEVYFEEQNIYTLDSKGELLITIMSSLAQEEAHNISDNTKWGRRKRFADGQVSVSYSRFLGYDKGPNGVMVVNPEQAQTVRMIFRWYLQGLSCYAIAKRLTQMGVKTATGKDVWQTTGVIGILKNEKYKGDAILQKTYIEDFISKKPVKNDGSVVPQYYVQGDHEAIIDPDTFDLVQAELERRSSGQHHYSGVSVYSSKIVCGDCGCWYGAKKRACASGHKRIMYVCNQKYEGNHKCTSPSLTEDQVKEIFVTAVNKLIKNRRHIVSNTEVLLKILEDTSEEESRGAAMEIEMEKLDVKIQNLVVENSHRAKNQNDYRQQYDELLSRFNAVKKERDNLTEKLNDVKIKAAKMRRFIEDLKTVKDPLQDFDEQLWCAMVDHIDAKSEDDICVVFRDGTEVAV